MGWRVGVGERGSRDATLQSDIATLRSLLFLRDLEAIVDHVRSMLLIFSVELDGALHGGAAIENDIDEKRDRVNVGDGCESRIFSKYLSIMKNVASTMVPMQKSMNFNSRKDALRFA